MRLPTSVYVLLTILIAFALTPVGPVRADDAADKQAFEEAIRQYLLENPEVVVEALQRYQAAERERENQRRREMIVTHRDQLINDGHSFVKGAPDADVTIVEFFDYKCGFCRRSLPALRALVESDPKVRIVYKEFPILGQESVIAARAALASIPQGKYYEFHNALMSSRQTLDEANVLAIAREVGLDAEKIKADMYGEEIADALRKNYGLAETLGVEGTPAFVIGDTFVPGALSAERLAQLVEEARTGCVTC